MTFILDLCRSFNVLWLRYVFVTVAVVGAVASIWAWIKLKRKNRRYKIRSVSLKKLRDMLSVQPKPFVVQFTLAQLKVFDVNAYHVSLPHQIIGGDDTVLCVYSRQVIPNGFYTFVSRSDCLIFTLVVDQEVTGATVVTLEQLRVETSNFVFALHT